MRRLLLTLVLPPLLAGSLRADPGTFQDGRFALEFPSDWKKAKGPEDGNVLYHEAPKGEGSFSVFTLAVQKDHRANLEGTLKSRLESIAKAGLKVTAEVEGQDGNVDGKKAVFAVIPVEATLGEQTVKFRYYLVLVDAIDTVVILQATLSSPATPALQKTTLGIIESFKETKPEK